MQTSEKTTNNTFQISTHPLLMAGLLMGALALAACQPIRDPAVIAAEQTAVASGSTVEASPAAEETSEAVETPTAAIPDVEAATATISTNSLRVRALPSEEAEVVASVTAGDTFTVTGISSDGEWIQISIEESSDGLGWVAAGFVTLAGDITNIAVVDVETAEATATEEATVEATATEEATTEATTEATVTEEVTEEPTAAATPEATPEATVTVEATDVVTAEATVEATPAVTVEATLEATSTLTVEATVEATPVVTAEATVEATTTVTVEATPVVPGTPTPDLGTVTIVVELPLRVRSEPTAEVENKIGSVYNLEVYTVLEVSEDGLWIRIETPQFPEGSGWVSAEFVVYNEAE